MLKKRLKTITLLAAIVFLTAQTAVIAQAASIKPTKTTVKDTNKKITVKTVKYDEDWDKDDDNNLEIKFATKVKWKNNVTVSAKNEKGTSFEAYVDDTDNDECELYIENLAPGHTYTVVLNGVKARTADKYGSLTVTFTIPTEKSSSSSSTSTKAKLKEAGYDADDMELDLEFTSRVKFSKNVSIVIKDSSGKKVDAEIIETGSKDIEIYAELTEGKTYTFTLKGIRLTSEKNYGTLTGKFVAEDN